MASRLFPTQCCFIVQDVRAAADACEAHFGWGPFHHFRADVPEAHYDGWSGRRVNDVALGMAGRVQVELLHVHQGREPVADYQARYGTGFQHLGVGCRSIEGALERLLPLGARVAERNEHEGISIAFVDVPTGPAMFELLQFPPKGEGDQGIEASARAVRETNFALDRVTIVTPDMDATLRFYASAFDWEAPVATEQRLRHAQGISRLRRVFGRAGVLELELLQPVDGEDPYAAHLVRGEHGLVHAGGVTREPLGNPVASCEWLDTGEVFELYDWVTGPRTLQARRV